MSVDERGRVAAQALHDSSRALEPDELLEQLHRTRQRRNRAKVAAAAVAVAVAVAGGASLVNVGDQQSAPPVDTPNSVGKQPVRLTIDDAVPFEPTVLHEQVVAVDDEGSTALTYGGITDDGMVLVYQYPTVFDTPHQAGLLDPSTHEVTWLEPPTHGGVPLLLGRNQLVFAEGPEEGRYFNVNILDRSSGAWTRTRVDTIEADPYQIPDDDAIFLQQGWSPFLAADGRVWFRGGANFRGSPPPREWWSASPTESGPARLEEVDADAGASRDGQFQFASGHGRLLSRIDASGELTVRDLLDDSAWSASPPEGCSFVGVSTTADRVVTARVCPDGSDGVVAFDHEGSQVLEITGAALFFEFDDSLDGSVGITAPARGSFYVLDLDEPALYRASANGCQGHEFPPEAGGGLIAWCHEASPPGTPVGQPADEVTYRVAKVPGS